MHFHILIHAKVSSSKKYRQAEDVPVDPTAEERAQKIKEKTLQIQRLREALARNEVRLSRCFLKCFFFLLFLYYN